MSNSLASPQVKKRDMRSPRFSNEENWQKLLLASTFLIGFSAVVFSTSRREREARHDLLKADVLRKESIDDDDANTIRVMRRILSLNKETKEDDDELKTKRRREEVERLVREELERKRESGKVKVLEE